MINELMNISMAIWSIVYEVYGFTNRCRGVIEAFRYAFGHSLPKRVFFSHRTVPRAKGFSQFLRRDVFE